MYRAENEVGGGGGVKEKQMKLHNVLSTTLLRPIMLITQR